MGTLYLYVLNIVDDSGWMGRLGVCQFLSAVMPATAFGRALALHLRIHPHC